MTFKDYLKKHKLTLRGFCTLHSMDYHMLWPLVKTDWARLSQINANKLMEITNGEVDELIFWERKNLLEDKDILSLKIIIEKKVMNKMALSSSIGIKVFTLSKVLNGEPIGARSIHCINRWLENQNRGENIRDIFDRIKSLEKQMMSVLEELNNMKLEKR